ASGKADDDAHRPRGIGFRASKAGCGWQSSRSCDEMKELATIDRQDACPKNRARRLRVPRQHDSIRLTPACCWRPGSTYPTFRLLRQAASHHTTLKLRR